jgi:hypothetical protein
MLYYNVECCKEYDNALWSRHCARRKIEKQDSKNKNDLVSSVCRLLIFISLSYIAIESQLKLAFGELLDGCFNEAHVHPILYENAFHSQTRYFSNVPVFVIEK